MFLGMGKPCSIECLAIKAKELLGSKFNDLSLAWLLRTGGNSILGGFSNISRMSTIFSDCLQSCLSAIYIQLQQIFYILSQHLAITPNRLHLTPNRPKFTPFDPSLHLQLALLTPKLSTPQFRLYLYLQHIPKAPAMASVTAKQSYDYMFKVIVIGDSGVGKTNLILRFSDKNFNNNYVATIGVDFKIKTLTIGDKRVRLQLWDTAGQERFRTITQTYYKGAAGIVLTYSIDDRKTFENISKWMKQIKQKTPPHVQKLIVANKCDLESERKVQYEEGENLAKELSDNGSKVQFMEVSAKSGKNVLEAFTKISEQIKEHVESTQNYTPKNTVIRIEGGQGKDRNCAC